MELTGQETILDEMTIILPRRNSKPITIRIQALSIGFDETLEERIPSPVAPVKDFCRDKKGKFIYDPRTGKPIPFRDDAAPDFKVKERLASKRQSCLMVFEAFKADESLKWNPETYQAEKDEDWSTVADNVIEEMKTSHFSLGDLKIIIENVSKISNLGDDEVKEATESFLSGKKT